MFGSCNGPGLGLVLHQNICVAFAQKLINSEMFDFQFIVQMFDFPFSTRNNNFLWLRFVNEMKTFWISFMHHIMVEMSFFTNKVVKMEWYDLNTTCYVILRTSR